MGGLLGSAALSFGSRRKPRTGLETRRLMLPCTHHPSFFPPQARVPEQEWKSRHLTPTSGETKFLTFLASYGSGGVPLRELIMLGTLRLLGENLKNHWLEDGDVGSLQEAIQDIPESGNCSFLVDGFMGVMSNNSAIETFQARLESLGLIDVKYPEGGQSHMVRQYWQTDERVWIIRGNQWDGPRAHSDDSTVIRELVDVFVEIPGKGVSPASLRQREVYYFHAHLLIDRVMRFPGALAGKSKYIVKTVFVILHLLTHHYQGRDVLLLQFAKEVVRRQPRLYPGVSLMLLWAEMKEIAFRNDYEGLCTIRDRLLDRMLSEEDFSRATPLQRGLVGFILVDLMHAAKAARFEDIARDTLKAGTDWVSRSPMMDSTMERTALCDILATLDIHNREKAIPLKCYLFYGYNLSRAGFLVQGDRFLARGLQHYDFDPKLWYYQFERVSIALRLGRREEAEKMLASIKETALIKRDDSGLWKKSGQCAEVFILLNLYEADCSASEGRLDKAYTSLTSGINITTSMRDAYIGTLRITLEMRLLEVCMWQRNFRGALIVAHGLAKEAFDPRARLTFTPDTIRAMVHQILDLSNALLSTGDAEASFELLEDVKSIEYLPGVLSEEVRLHVQQRMTTVRQFQETREIPRQKLKKRTSKTSIEEFIGQAQTDLRTDRTALNKADIRAGPSEPSASSKPSAKMLPKLSQAKYLQARRKKDVQSPGSEPSFEAKRLNSTSAKLLRAPRPPTTEPASSHPEKYSRPNDNPLQMTLQPILA